MLAWIALAIDGWRQDREELRQNLRIVERIRVLQPPRKIENLQTVLQFLNDPEADVQDPVARLP